MITKKQTLLIILVLILVALIGWQGFLYTKKYTVGVAPIGSGDPFARIEVPSGVDAATRAVMESHIQNARELYEKYPDVWESWIAVGNVRRLVKDYRGAISAYQKSLELQSNNILGHVNIAEVYNMDLKDYEQAEAHYRLAIDNSFNNPDLYITLALMQYRQLGKNEEAEKTYIQGLRNTSFNKEILIALIEFYNYTGNDEKYRENIQLLLLQNPDNESYRRRYGEALQ